MRETIASIQEQSYQNFEHIIIDGESNDGTQHYIRSSQLTNLKLYSESDNGLYDGMNKGIKNSDGDFIIFINAGDTFFSKFTLCNVASCIDDSDKVYFGKTIIKSSDLDSWHFPPSYINISNIKIWLLKNLPNHQSIFFPKKFCKKQNYNLNLEISADSDYKERALRDQSFAYLDLPISYFKMDGVSSKRDARSLYQQCVDRFNRFESPKRYYDLITTIPKLFFKWVFFLLFGQKSFKIIHKIKYIYDFILISILLKIKK